MVTTLNWSICKAWERAPKRQDSNEWSLSRIYKSGAEQTTDIYWHLLVSEVLDEATFGYIQKTDIIFFCLLD